VLLPCADSKLAHAWGVCMTLIVLLSCGVFMAGTMPSLA
jgi:hypothetical protein